MKRFSWPFYYYYYFKFKKKKTIPISRTPAKVVTLVLRVVVGGRAANAQACCPCHTVGDEFAQFAYQVKLS